MVKSCDVGGITFQTQNHGDKNASMSWWPGENAGTCFVTRLQYKPQRDKFGFTGDFMENGSHALKSHEDQCQKYSKGSHHVEASAAVL